MSADQRPAQLERPTTARVFFALWPSPRLAQQLGEHARAAANHFGGRATRPETIHLTLAFLGQVAETRLAELAAAASAVKVPPFSLTIDQTGFWPRQRLLWAGLREPAEPLRELHERLLKALLPAGFTPAGEPRNFLPHVTLVRKTAIDAASFKAADLPSLAPLAWPCRRFVLVRSSRDASASTYRVIQAFSLGNSRT